ncbi:MAG: hypothetical protein PHN75_10505 [Syntrophales bacterium]|nr:hypothetical protein [Syntrophales bacterium]
MEKKDYLRYPTLEGYVLDRIEGEFATRDMEEAQKKCLSKLLRDHIPFDTAQFGPYPELLKPLLDNPRYRIRYDNGRIVGRDES